MGFEVTDFFVLIICILLLHSIYRYKYSMEKSTTCHRWQFSRWQLFPFCV